MPDTLSDPGTASAVLRPFRRSGAMEVSPEGLAGIRALRATLVNLVTGQDGTEAAKAWTELSERTSSVTLRQEFSAPGKVRMRQVTGDPVIGGITLAVAELVEDGTWSRIRVCADERCGHAFYDSTRSRTRRWHSYETCGNRRNVAAYRARQKARLEG
ncbi:CGNR zinc finger domain-containing protein [Streptomyces sp. NPDC047706]|uniref:CGNR zinc finger domain-containing protein n=1 Tax=Streptomyces sp. NPDC047706 TaxID=3365486 RepID=UPI003717C330